MKRTIKTMLGAATRPVRFRRALGIAAAFILTASGVVGISLPASATDLAAPATCSIQTFNTRNYLTAVDGGGRTTNVIQSNRTAAKSWETFTLVPAGDGVHVGLRTTNGNFLTAIGGGGRITDVLASTATVMQGWEMFNIIRFGGDGFAIQTINGRYLTAVSGGGRTSDVIHSDATLVQAWELFLFNCR